MFLYLKSQSKLLNLERVVEVRLEGSALVFLLDHGAVRVDFPTPEEARGALEALMVELIFKKRMIPLRQK
ncbi:hypothetical protein SAMN04488243_1358 [Thermus arciformis]|uniref:Uncharacterized protein n=1 Tax=Thermus arciformis TaxID=482827 RepID=A0A1G7JJ75_9DEIN|nr:MULTISPECIES: hypothetical protein [Thermus]SDF24943.1 hypothetical protein SAMN04488243_1358 [Thermus arciformis]